MKKPKLDKDIIDATVFDFINSEILPLVNYSSETFWQDFNTQYNSHNNKIVPISSSLIGMKVTYGSWYSLIEEGNTYGDGFSNALEFLNNHFPLFFGTHNDVVGYKVDGEYLLAYYDAITFTSLKKPSQFEAFSSDKEQPKFILLKKDDFYLQLELNDHVYNKEKAIFTDIKLRTEQSIIINFEPPNPSGDSSEQIKAYNKIKAILKQSENQKLKTTLTNLKVTYTNKDCIEFVIPDKTLSLVDYKSK